MFRIADHITSAQPVKEGSHLYKAVRSDGRKSAVQVFPLAMSPQQYSAFTEQSHLLAEVASRYHVNIPAILNWGYTQTGNSSFIEREWIEGFDLTELPNRNKTITVEEVGTIAEQMSRILTQCHNVGIMHGNIKAKHVIWDTKREHYSLTGFRFGLQSVESSSRMMNALQQEIYSKEKDIHDLGLLLFQLITKHLLPGGLQLTDVDALTNQTLNDGSTVPNWLATCISRALSSDEEKFTDAHEMYSYIILHHKTPPPPNKWYRSKPQQPSTVRVKAVVKTTGSTQKKLRSVLNSGVQRGRQEMRFVFDRRIAVGLVIAGVLAGFSIIAQKRENEKVRRQSMGMSSSPQQYATAVTNEAIEDSSETTIIQKNRTAAAAEKKTVQLKKTEKKKTVEKTPSANSVSEKAESNGDVGAYKVRSKAYFHNEPDESSRRNAFIVHWNNAVLHPIKEENDFVYVVFTNDEGQTSKGWLRKKDLVKL